LTTNTHLFNGHFSGTTRVSWYQKGKTNLDFTEARDSEWQWHQLGHICKSAPRSRQITMPARHHSVFLQAGCPSCHPTNSVKALKAILVDQLYSYLGYTSMPVNKLYCKCTLRPQKSKQIKDLKINI